MGTHPHSALQIYQFLTALHHSCLDKETFEAILLSLQTPRFTSVSTIFDRWSPAVSSKVPDLFNDFQQLLQSAFRSPEYDAPRNMCI